MNTVNSIIICPILSNWQQIGTELRIKSLKVNATLEHLGIELN